MSFLVLNLFSSKTFKRCVFTDCNLDRFYVEFSVFIECEFRRSTFRKACLNMEFLSNYKHFLDCRFIECLFKDVENGFVPEGLIDCKVV